MPKRVQLHRTKGWRKPDGAVVVTRSSKLWGNPFRIGTRVPEPWSLTSKYEGRVVEDRRMAVELFESYTQIKPFYVELAQQELAGKDLCCVCPLDEPCHADVLLKIANQNTSMTPASPGVSGQEED
jgi:hypothetical protein